MRAVRATSGSSAAAAVADAAAAADAVGAAARSTNTSSSEAHASTMRTGVGGFVPSSPPLDNEGAGSRWATIARDSGDCEGDNSCGCDCDCDWDCELPSARALSGTSAAGESVLWVKRRMKSPPSEKASRYDGEAEVAWCP